MVTKFVVLLLAVAYVAGQQQAGTVLGANVAGMSDRELIELLVKSLSHLETERVKHQERIEALEDTVLKQHGVITELQAALEKQELDKEAVSGDDESNSEQNTFDNPPSIKQSRSVMSQKNAHRVARQVPDTPVAFSALDGPNLLHLGAHQNLIFNIDNVNTNNVYNPHHGVFTVPVPGVYVITSSVLALNNREVWCDITVNGAPRAHIYARGTDGRHDQGSQTILLHLKKGDDVTIQNEAADDAIWGDRYTSFSGFLLYEEEPTDIVG